ncbi:MAG TPA: hypothetical protein VF618_24635 [Thermoanaerobaculia bacterium]
MLQTLPRTSASQRFTSDVLRAVRRTRDEETVAPRRLALSWKLSVAVAVALSLVVVVRLAIVQHAHENKLQVLRAEHQRIEAELAKVKEAATEADDNIVVIEDGDTRYIVELGSQTPPATPASYAITD